MLNTVASHLDLMDVASSFNGDPNINRLHPVHPLPAWESAVILSDKDRHYQWPEMA